MYFDNLQVTQAHGRIIEEDHYYAYGLKIAAISSRKLGDVNEGYLKNNNLYNDKELWDDADLNWYDYGFRNYDPQIGRFLQLDPLTWLYSELTPYQYGSNDPILNIDLDGLEGIPFNAVQTIETVTLVSHISKAATTASTLTKILTFANFAKKAAYLGTEIKMDYTSKVSQAPRIGLDGVSIRHDLYIKNSSARGGKSETNEGTGDGGGYALTSANAEGEGTDRNRRSSNAGPSINVDYLSVAASAIGRLPPYESPDITDLKDLAENMKKAAEASQIKVNYSAIAQKFKSSRPDKGIDPIFFRKKGTVIYNRLGGGYNLELDGYGHGTLTITKPATDTFPRFRVPPDYMAPN